MKCLILMRKILKDGIAEICKSDMYLSDRAPKEIREKNKSEVEQLSKELSFVQKELNKHCKNQPHESYECCATTCPCGCTGKGE